MTMWNYPFPLIDGRLASLHLPPDLNRRDADRLKAMIDSLVITDDDQPEDRVRKSSPADQIASRSGK